MNGLNATTNRRVLIIDDNHAIHEDFHKILGDSTGGAIEDAEAALFGRTANQPPTAGFELDYAAQGMEGLEKVRRAVAEGRPYAVAFIDVRMPPGWDGIETTAKIWEVYPDLQVVICTAYSDYSWDEMIAKIGQSDRLVILKKPFDNVEVLQLANALTAKWALVQQVQSRIEDLEKVLAGRTVELRENEERFQLVMDVSNTGYWDWDLRTNAAYLSPVWKRQLGHTDAEIPNRFEEWADRLHPDDRQRAIATTQAYLAKPWPNYELEFRLRHKDGGYRHILTRAAAIDDEQGKPCRMMGVHLDLSERKRAEEQHRSMEIQLRHAQKMESIGQLAAGIAHEINTPTQYIGDNTRFVRDAFGDISRLVTEYDKLWSAAEAGAVTPELLAAVKSAAAAADMGYLSAEIPKAIQQSLDGVDRVAQIVRAMKDFSHPGTNEKTPIDLNRSIESTLTVCRNEWKYVAEMVTTFDPDLPPVPCLPGEINQTILNIVVNAAHAIGDVVGDGSRGQGAITVTTLRQGDWAEIRIRDTGTGIPEHARARVFDPFFTTKGVGKGTGQGLAIAHSVITDKHGGRITFETETGQGTTFIIRLPLMPKEVRGQKPEVRNQISDALTSDFGPLTSNKNAA